MKTNPPSVPCSSFHLSEHAKYKLDPHTLCLDCLAAFLMQCNVQQLSNVQPAASGGGEAVTTNCEAIITHCVQIFLLAGGVFYAKSLSIQYSNNINIFKIPWYQSIGINQHQSASIRINQNQSAPISTNHHKSNQYQSASASIRINQNQSDQSVILH